MMIEVNVVFCSLCVAKNLFQLYQVVQMTEVKFRVGASVRSAIST